MKIIIFISFFIISIFISIPNITFAQEEGLSIVAVNYQTRQDIDFLFQNSTQVLEYLEGIDIDTPTFLSVVNEEQKTTIEEKGYVLKILDTDIDINRYVLLYNPQPNEAEKLRSFGQPIVISDHYTLLRLAPGQQFTHSGESGRFFDIPFSKIISPPPLQTKTVDIAVSPTPKVEQTGNNYTPFVVVGILMVLIAFGIVGYLYFIRRRRNSEF